MFLLFYGLGGTGTQRDEVLLLFKKNLTFPSNFVPLTVEYRHINKKMYVVSITSPYYFLSRVKHRLN